MKVKLIIGNLTTKAKPWWMWWSRTPIIYKEENLEMAKLVNFCRTDEITEHGLLSMYWAKNPNCLKGDEFLLMKVDPYYHDEWLAGDACRIIGIPRSKS